MTETVGNEQESTERVCLNHSITDGCSGPGNTVAQISNKNIKRVKRAKYKGTLY